jgi:hypothetical protein
MKYLLLTITILSLGQSLSAQTDQEISNYRIVFPEHAPVKTDSATSSTVKLKEKPKNLEFKLNIDSSVAYIIDTITHNNKNIKKAKGYRVAVYNGPDKAEMRKAKEYVYALFPDVNILSEYKQPDYKLKVGDYLTRFEAFEALGKIAVQYPDALIVPEIVDINPPKSNE